MQIVICASIDFTFEIKKIADELEKMGHTVDLPLTSQKILRGELTMEEFQAEKRKNGDSVFRKVKDDVIRRYYNKIIDSDAILVANYQKKGIKNYIGGNTFLEMGFAYVLNKKIFLLNPIPEMGYKDELEAMQPIVVNGDLARIVKVNFLFL